MFQRFFQAAASLLAASLVLVSCSTTKSSVDDALLERLTARERAEISESIEAKDRALAELESAKQRALEAKQDIRIARSGLKVAKAQLEQAELLVESSGSSSVAEMTATRVTADWHRARVDASVASLGYAKARESWARQTVRHAKNELDLQSARVELEKVRAVRELRGADKSMEEVLKFERLVAEHSESQSYWDTQVAKAKEGADRALAEWNAATERAGALTP